MRHIKNQETLSLTKQQLFDLVNDTESYSHFVPYCSKGQVIEVIEGGKIASLTFSGMGLEASIVTKNLLNEPESIQLSLVSGPFKSLQGLWKFEDLDGQTQVSLSFDYELSTDWGDMMVSAMLEELIKRMSDLFIKEAKRRYA